MLDRLIPELLEKVLLFSTIPPPFHLYPNYDEFYIRAEETRTLRACCLVSKHLRLHAQPLVWRQFVVSLSAPQGTTRAEAALSTKQGALLAKRVRSVLAVKVSKEMASCFLQQTVNVQEVLLSHCSDWEFALSELEALPSEKSSLFPAPPSMLTSFSCTDLSSLTLFFVKPITFSAPFYFPAVTSLALSSVFLSVSDASLLLTTATFPSVQAISLGRFFHPAIGIRRGGGYLPSLALDLFDQLDMVQYSADCLPADSHPTSPLTLITCDRLTTTNTVPPRSHLRYVPPGYVKDNLTRKDDTITVLMTLAQLPILITSPSPPLSLRLPALFRTLDRTKTPQSHQLVEEFIAVCQKQRFEVIWEENELHQPFAVHRPFWEFAKAEKAKGRR